MRKSLRALLHTNIKHYSGHHLTGEALAKFMRKVRDLGLDQMNEQAAGKAVTENH